MFETRPSFADHRREPGDSTAAAWRIAAAAALALLGLAGCAAYRQLVGEDTVSLQNAEVQRMEVDIRRPVKRICPREPVQMGVTVDARLEGQSSVTRIETWEGDPKVRRNGKLDFGNFAFASRQGTFDEFGFFLPNGDIMRHLLDRVQLSTRPARPGTRSGPGTVDEAPPRGDAPPRSAGRQGRGKTAPPGSQ
jgi:hypothetical protein